MKFQTRKDKIIEEQKARIESLEQRLFSDYYKRPMIIEQQREIITIGCHHFLEDGMSVEQVKEIIARDMANELKKFIEYDIEDGSVRDYRPYPLVTGYLKVGVRR